MSPLLQLLSPLALALTDKHIHQPVLYIVKKQLEYPQNIYFSSFSRVLRSTNVQPRDAARAYKPGDKVSGYTVNRVSFSYNLWYMYYNLLSSVKLF